MLPRHIAIDLPRHLLFGFQGASFKDSSSLVNKSEFGDDVTGEITKLEALKLLRIILRCIIRKKKTSKTAKKYKKIKNKWEILILVPGKLKFYFN